MAKKGPGKEAKLSYMGHTVMENRHGLIVKAAASLATGKAEREVAADLLAALPGMKKRTVGADKNYDTAGFVEDCRAMNITPHVARNDNRTVLEVPPSMAVPVGKLDTWSASGAGSA